MSKSPVVGYELPSPLFGIKGLPENITSIRIDCPNPSSPVVIECRFFASEDLVNEITEACGFARYQLVPVDAQSSD